MAAPVILVEASPRRAADGVAEPVRLAGAGAVKPYRYPDAAGGADQDWRAGIVSLPTIVCALEFDGRDLGTGAVPQAAEIVWAPARAADLDALAAYFWFDAAIKVRVGPEGASPPVILAGKVLNGMVIDGQLRLQLADPAASLKKPFPLARYLGTGNLEGPAEWAGKLKDRVWGRVWNKRGEPLDKANNIYAFADPARPLQSIDAVRDKGAAAAALTTVAWQGTAAATLAALRAAVAPQGGGVTCPSLACVKWWTQPAGDLCADLKGEAGSGYVETTAEITSTLVAALAGPAFAAGTVAAATAARPAPIGWVVSDDTTTVAAMLDELLGNVSLLWVLGSTGEVVIRQWAWGASAAAAKSHKVTRNATLRPVHTRKIGYQRNELPMARGDLAAIVLASDATYLDGTTLEALKPAEGGANVTATHTAAAIAGQGAFATRSTIAGDSDLSGALALRLSPHPLDANFIDSTRLVYAGGGPIDTFQPAEFGANITENRTAAAIAGQGALATLSAAAWSTQITGKPAPVADLDTGGYLRASYIRTGDTGVALDSRWPEEANANRTETRVASAIAGQAATATSSDFAAVSGTTRPENNATVGATVGTNVYRPGGVIYTQAELQTDQGTAAAIAGQGAFATRSTIATDADLSGALANRLMASAVDANFLRASRVIYTDTSSVEALKPLEAGANITETRTAAAIAGQGAFATRSTIATDADLGGVLANRLSPHPLDANFIDSTRLVYAGGGPIDTFQPAEFGANVTENRTAAAIAGQGAFATVSSVAYGSGFLTGFGALATRAKIALGDGYVFLADATTQLTDALAVTSLGTAAAIAGQGAFATRSTIATDADLGGALANRLMASAVDANFLRASRVIYTDTSSVEALKPLEAGANITETRVASAIAGQAATATSSDFAAVTGATRPANNATVGGTVGTNVYKPGGVIYTQAELQTDQGTAAGFAGQAPAATDPTIEPAADVTKQVSGPAASELNYASDGTTLTSPVPKSITGFALVKAGGGTISSGVTWTVAVASGTVTGTAPSMSGGGVGTLAFNSGIDSVSVVLDIAATYLGKAYGPFKHTVSKKVAEPPVTGGGAAGTYASDTIAGVTNSVSYAAISPDVTVTIGSGGIATITPTGNVFNNGTAPWTANIKVQRKTAPDTYADTGEVITRWVPAGDSRGFSWPSPPTYSGTGSQSFRVVAAMLENSGGEFMSFDGTIRVQG